VFIITQLNFIITYKIMFEEIIWFTVKKYNDNLILLVSILYLLPSCYLSLEKFIKK